MSANILTHFHGVTRIEVERPNYLGGGSCWTRYVRITNAAGVSLEIACFADEPAQLAVRDALAIPRTYEQECADLGIEPDLARPTEEAA